MLRGRNAALGCSSMWADTMGLRVGISTSCQLRKYNDIISLLAKNRITMNDKGDRWLVQQVRQRRTAVGHIMSI